jgi:hypothetical protein
LKPDSINEWKASKKNRDNYQAMNNQSPDFSAQVQGMGGNWGWHNDVLFNPGEKVAKV